MFRAVGSMLARAKGSPQAAPATPVWPLKDERDPTAKHDEAPQNKDACAIARERWTALSHQQARKHDAAAGCEKSRDRGGELFERIKNDVREDQPVRRAFEEAPVSEAGCMNDLHFGRHAVQSRIV